MIVSTTNKTCKICKIEQPKSNFLENRHQCKACRNIYKKTLETRKGDGLRRYNLYKKYKLTLQDYDQLLINQNFKCKICNNDSGATRWKKLVVDHCHISNSIRGLLCDKCNKGLGQFNDNITLLNNAINYLNSNPPSVKKWTST